MQYPVSLQEQTQPRQIPHTRPPGFDVYPLRQEVFVCGIAGYFSSSKPVGKIPPVELIRETHKFPGVYTFKVIIEERPEFMPELLPKLVKLLGEGSRIQHSQRRTSSGKHSSFTIEIHCDTAEQVVEIYQELTETSGVVLIL